MPMPSQMNHQGPSPISCGSMHYTWLVNDEDSMPHLLFAGIPLPCPKQSM